ncbi:MAG TPA: hypothetical protein VD948_09330 [Rhodothermales bacterium]|nr:hypothetical protein [Rhodothermales bacterium]
MPPGDAVGTGVDLRAWTTQAEALAGDTARLARDFEGAVAEMRRHALALVPDLASRCEVALDLPGAGAISVEALSETERFVTLACDGGAVLGNQTLVPVYVRLGDAPAARVLPVPAFREGALVQDRTISGLMETHGREVTVTNRCCAGSQGTTTHYRIEPGGALTLVRVEEWTMDAEDAPPQVAVVYPKP